MKSAQLTDEQLEAIALEHGYIWGDAEDQLRYHFSLEGLRNLLSALPVPDGAPIWNLDTGLIYSLNEHGTNHNEISVTMANGRRDNAARNELARRILAMLSATPDAAQESAEQAVKQGPVAYICQGTDDLRLKQLFFTEHMREEWLEDGSAWTPLYAHPAQSETCEWTYDEIDDKWDSSCGQSWVLNDGTPEENHMSYCHNCGGALKQKGEK